jgi:predicted HTH transcriptional regulator
MSGSIEEIIKKGEGLNIEFKSKIDSPPKIAKTIVSFANTSGGTLLIGVNDNGLVTGVGSELAELQKLEKALTHYIEPKIIVQIKSQILTGRKLLAVKVTESQEKPHYVVSEKGARIIYIRVKDKSVPIPKLLIYNDGDQQIEKLIATRHVKTLISYLKNYDSVNARIFSRMINISEKRAERLLQDLASKQILLKIPGTKPEIFSLKWSE